VYQTQAQRYVLRFEPPLYVPAFTQNDFHYVHTGPSTKGLPLRNYNSTLGVHNSSLKHNHLYTRGKAQNQSKEKGLQLGDLMITNSLDDFKGSQTIFSQNKDPKYRIRIDSSSVRIQSVLEMK